MNGKINGRHPSPQIAHYMHTYQDVPLWVLTTDLTIGETASMYRYLKGRCKTLVCNDFHYIGRNELGKMLVILTKYRNICAMAIVYSMQKLRIPFLILPHTRDCVFQR